MCSECIFNHGCLKKDDPDNCNLIDLVRNIQLQGFGERTPNNYLQSIEDKLNDIETLHVAVRVNRGVLKVNWEISCENQIR